MEVFASRTPASVGRANQKLLPNVLTELHINDVMTPFERDAATGHGTTVDFDGPSTPADAVWVRDMNLVSVIVEPERHIEATPMRWHARVDPKPFAFAANAKNMLER